MNQNQDFRFLHYPLPPDVVRLRESGDLKGAIRLIDKALIGDTHPELAARLRVERERLFRLPAEYPYPIDQAKAMMRREWPDMTDSQFQALMDNGRVDWRFIDGQIFCHDDFIETSRNYPLEAPGLKPEQEDTSARDQMLARMKAEGGLAAVSPSAPPFSPGKAPRVPVSRPGCPSPPPAPSRVKLSCWSSRKAARPPRWTPRNAPFTGTAGSGKSSLSPTAISSAPPMWICPAVPPTRCSPTSA